MHLLTNLSASASKECSTTSQIRNSKNWHSHRNISGNAQHKRCSQWIEQTANHWYSCNCLQTANMIAQQIQHSYLLPAPELCDMIVLDRKRQLMKTNNITRR